MKFCYIVIGDLRESPGRTIVKIEPEDPDDNNDQSDETGIENTGYMTMIKIEPIDPDDHTDQSDDTGTTMINNADYYSSPAKTEIDRPPPVKRKVNKKQSREKETEQEKHQNNIKEILLNTNATPIRCYRGIGYTCCFCDEQFPIPAHLKTHTIIEHTDEQKTNFMKNIKLHAYLVKLDITDLKCNICYQPIDDLEALINHLKITHNKNMFTEIDNYILPFKFGEDSHRCCICSDMFNTFKALQAHMNVHYRNSVCEVCDAGFVNRKIFLRHLLGHKTGEFKCEECAITFETARKKKAHEIAKHTSILPHKCGYCPQRFKEYLYKHEHQSKVHGIEKAMIICQVCDKRFKTTHELKVHTERIHLLQKNHKCSMCDKEFYALHELEGHMAKHIAVRQTFSQKQQKKAHKSVDC